MTSWEERMSQRAKARMAVAEAEDIARQAAEYVPTHLHGTMVACPCGVEVGITTVAFPEDYVSPDECEVCGKPFHDFDQEPVEYRRDVERHTVGCRHHPDAPLCRGCGQWIGPGVAVFGYPGGGPFHLGCFNDLT